MIAFFIDMVLGTLTIFTAIVVLCLLIPAISVGVRRLHDTNRSGWWFLLGLVPFANFVLLAFFFLDGTPGQNRFGTDPKGRA